MAETLTLGQQRDLLTVLTSGSRARADLIRQCFEAPQTRHLGEVLIDLEEDESARTIFIDALKGLTE